MSGTTTSLAGSDPLRLPPEPIRVGAATSAATPPPLGSRPTSRPAVAEQALPVGDRLEATSVPQGTFPATEVNLPPMPTSGNALRLGPNGLGPAVSTLMRGSAPAPGGRPQTSNWSDVSDLRLVLPVATARHGAWSSSVEMLPGQHEHWATVRVAQKPADARFNGDGLQAAVRVGVGGLMAGPSFTGALAHAPLHGSEFQWAEVRAGVEGLVATGQVVDGRFRLSRLELEEGFFKTQVNGVGQWAGDNLAVAIPLGLAVGGAAAYAISKVADKTGQDIALPLTAKVFERNGFSLHPTVRPIFGANEFMRFGGADLGLGYQIPGKVDLMVRPGWNLDPTNGATGPRVSARASMPINLPGKMQGAAGVGGSYDAQRGPTVVAGLSLRF